MPFKIVTFSYDDTHKKANIQISDGLTFINTIMPIDVQEDESIGGIKRKALRQLEGLFGQALREALDEMGPEHGPTSSAPPQEPQA